MNVAAVRGRCLGGAVLLSLVVAACGPNQPSPTPSDGSALPSNDVSASPTIGGSVSPSPASGLPSPEPSSSATATASAAPSTSTAPTTRPTAKPSATPTAGTSLSDRLCQKLTVADLESALGVAGIAVKAGQGDATSGHCTYVVGDRTVAATSWLAKGAAQAIRSHEGASDPVPGLGDQAIWDRPTNTLFIRAGDTLFGLQLLASIVAPDQIKATTISLGSAAAGRL